MPTDLRLLRTVQRNMERTLGERARVAEAAARRTAEIDHIEQELTDLLRRGEAAEAESLRSRLGRLDAERRAEIERLHDFDERFREILEELGRRVDPCDADPGVPLLLLPVRLETRYTADRKSLRVRIYPDDVHVDQLDSGLDDDERVAWEEYWTRVWHATDEEAETAWQRLVQRVGARRATWIAVGVPPTNLAERERTAAPVFGNVSPRARRAAVARLLPDAFVAVVVQGKDQNVVVGRPVAPEVTVGLLADDGSTFVDLDGLKIMPGAEWVVDYDAAVSVGMAVTVPLPSAGARVDRLVVMGVRRSLDPSATAAELERLLRAHQATRGLAFVPLGTPTNNTETERAGWHERMEPHRPTRGMPARPLEGTNAGVLAAALGIDAGVLAGLPDADLREQAHARAANTAFWGATWGAFLDKANRVGDKGATLSDSTIESIRVFHRDAMRGRGPLPALRIGNQPYGILPVSALEEPHWKTARRDTLESGLLDILRRARVKWRQAADKVSHVGTAPIDKAVKEMLGSSPISISLRVRTVLSESAADFGLKVSNGDPATQAVEALIEELILEEVILNASLIHRTGSLATRSRPLGLPYAHDDDIAAMDALLSGGRVPKVTSVWQALLRLSWDAARRDVEASGGGGRFADVVGLASTLSAADRQRVVATASSTDRLGSGALRAEAERVDAALRTNGGTATLAEFQPLAAKRLGFGELALQATSEAARATLAGFAASAHLHSLDRQTELREAVRELRETTREERRVLLAETLDIASHRLDTWFTGVVERRRASLRSTRERGLSVGAYGWVEGIEPIGDRQGDGGFVVAPSLSHAATAGVLRASYLAHNAQGGSGAFAIDLSSSRVRTALYLIDGIRNGQSLGALLGYRIERAIHEARLDRLILSLRTVAPLTQGKLTDRGENPPLHAIEALAAGNVTDGIDLIEKYQGKVMTWGAERVRQALSRKPDNPYLTGAAWPDPIPANEWNTIKGIIEDAAHDCDAVADLLMAEGVHQLVHGNMARASAALDAVAAGEAPPPLPAVVTTPIDGLPFTHRLLLVVNGPGRPWRPSRPRAAAEPHMEAWAGQRLGDPATIRVAENDGGNRLTLAGTDLCALDLVYDAGDRQLLEQRIRAALRLAAEAELYETPGDDWEPSDRAIGEVIEHAASLRALLANARPALPSDLARPQDDSVRSISRAALDAVVQRLTLAHGGLSAVIAELAGTLELDPLSESAFHTALERAAAYGLITPMVEGEQLALLVMAAQAEAERRADAAEKHLDEARATLHNPGSEDLDAAREALIAAGQAVFGEGFWLVPEIDVPTGPDLWRAALGADGLTVPGGAVRRFLADVASVREPVKRASDALLLSEAVGEAPSLRVAQLAPPGTAGAARWIGGALDPAEPSPEAPVTSVILDAPAGYDANGATAALVVDQWTDVVPVRERRGTADDAPIDERTTAGVSFNANAPSARAPQSMLLAVSPNGERWTTDLLLSTLLETLELAKLRLVTLEHTNGVARVLPALYHRSWSLQGEPALDFRFVTGVNYHASAIAAYVKE